jgi:hypothetical protein
MLAEHLTTRQSFPSRRSHCGRRGGIVVDEAFFSRPFSRLNKPLSYSKRTISKQERRPMNYGIPEETLAAGFELVCYFVTFLAAAVGFLTTGRL